MERGLGYSRDFGEDFCIGGAGLFHDLYYQQQSIINPKDRRHVGQNKV